jgi:insulysin
MNPKEPNSAVEVIYQGGDLEGYSMGQTENTKIATEGLLELLAHLISEPAFDQLRTKEQLGYIVHTAVKKVGQVGGLHMIVQSSHKDPIYLDERIEEFLVGFRVKLAGLSAEELQNNIQAVRERLLEKPKNLDQESSQYWEEIKNATYLFDRKERLALFLCTVTLEDCVVFFDRHISKGSSERKKCSSQFFGKGTRYPKTVAENVVLIKDPTEFKRGMSLQPIKIFNVAKV